MNNLLFTAASIALLFSSPSWAQEFMPYPRAKITVAQWQAYFDEVREKHGATAEEFEDRKLLVYLDSSTRTVYRFTKPGHPAHPAWIALKVEQRGSGIFLRSIGYFAGEEQPFQQFFRENVGNNNKNQETVHSQQQEKEKQ